VRGRPEVVLGLGGVGGAGGCSGPPGVPVRAGSRASGPSAAALARAMCSIACAGRLDGASWPGWGRGVLAAAAGRRGHRSGGLAGFRASGPSAAALARAMCSIACAGRLEVRLGLGGVGGAGGCSGPAGTGPAGSRASGFRAKRGCAGSRHV